MHLYTNIYSKGTESIQAPFLFFNLCFIAAICWNKKKNSVFCFSSLCTQQPSLTEKKLKCRHFSKFINKNPWDITWSEVFRPCSVLSRSTLCSERSHESSWGDAIRLSNPCSGILCHLLCRSSSVLSAWTVNVCGQPFSGLSRDLAPLGSGQDSGWDSQQRSQSYFSPPLQVWAIPTERLYTATSNQAKPKTKRETLRRLKC